MPDDFDSFMQSRQPAPPPPASPGDDFDSFMEGRKAPPAPKPEDMAVTSIGKPTWSGATKSTPVSYYDANDLKQQTGEQMRNSALARIPPELRPPPSVTADLPQPGDAVAQAEAEARRQAGILSDVGEQMHHSALSKIPHDLRGYTPEELAQPMGADRFGEVRNQGQIVNRDQNNFAVEGGRQILHGTEQMAEPGDADKLRGAGKAFLGGVELATPAMAGLGATAPLDAAAWYALSKGVSGLGEAGGKAAGLNDEDAKEAGDVAGALPLLYGFGKVAEGKFSDAIDAHNARAEELIKGDTKQATGKDQAEAVLGQQSIDVRGTDGWKIEPAGATRKGRPIFRVTDANGKTLYSGNGNDVQGWLETNGVQKTKATAPTPEELSAEAVSDGSNNPFKPGDRVMADAKPAATGKTDFNGNPLPDFPADIGSPATVSKIHGDDYTRIQRFDGSEQVVPTKSLQPAEADDFLQGHQRIADNLKQQISKLQDDISQAREYNAPKAKVAELKGYLQKARDQQQAITQKLSDLSAETPKVTLKPPPAPRPNDEEMNTELPPRAPVTPPAVGKPVNVEVPGESTTYSARYAIREAADVQPSHNPQTFEKNPSYDYENDRDYSTDENKGRVVDYSAKGNFKPNRALTPSDTAEQGAPILDQRGNVLGGNNRSMTIQRVYAGNPQGATDYRKKLKDEALTYGIDPAEVGRFKDPVLVRELTGTPTRRMAQQAITDFNKTASAKLSPEEQAVADGRRLSQSTISEIGANLGEVGEDSTLAQALRGEKGTDIIHGLVSDGVITAQERNGYIDDRGQLTGTAKDRIAKALVGRLFDTPSDLREAPQDVRNKLERIAPQLLRVEGRRDWDLVQPVREALGAIADARAHGLKSLDDLGNQQSLAGTSGRKYSPEVLAIGKKLQESPTSAQRAFRQYATDADLSKDGSQVHIFEPPTRAEAFETAFGVKPEQKEESDDDRTSISVDGVGSARRQGEEEQRTKEDGEAGGSGKSTESKSAEEQRPAEERWDEPSRQADAGGTTSNAEADEVKLPQKGEGARSDARIFDEALAAALKHPRLGSQPHLVREEVQREFRLSPTTAKAVIDNAVQIYNEPAFSQKDHDAEHHSDDEPDQDNEREEESLEGEDYEGDDYHKFVSREEPDDEFDEFMEQRHLDQLNKAGEAAKPKNAKPDKQARKQAVERAGSERQELAAKSRTFASQILAHARWEKVYRNLLADPKASRKSLAVAEQMVDRFAEPLVSQLPHHALTAADIREDFEENLPSEKPARVETKAAKSETPEAVKETKGEVHSESPKRPPEISFSDLSRYSSSSPEAVQKTEAKQEAKDITLPAKSGLKPEHQTMLLARAVNTLRESLDELEPERERAGTDVKIRLALKPALIFEKQLPAADELVRKEIRAEIERGEKLLKSAAKPEAAKAKTPGEQIIENANIERDSRRLQDALKKGAERVSRLEDLAATARTPLQRTNAKRLLTKAGEEYGELVRSGGKAKEELKKRVQGLADRAQVALEKLAEAQTATDAAPKKETTAQRVKRLVAEGQQKHGTLKPSDLKPGDVVEHMGSPGEQFEVERVAGGNVFGRDLAGQKTSTAYLGKVPAFRKIAPEQANIRVNGSRSEPAVLRRRDGARDERALEPSRSAGSSEDLARLGRGVGRTADDAEESRTGSGSVPAVPAGSRSGSDERRSGEPARGENGTGQPAVESGRLSKTSAVADKPAAGMTPMEMARVLGKDQEAHGLGDWLTSRLHSGAAEDYKGDMPTWMQYVIWGEEGLRSSDYASYATAKELETVREAGRKEAARLGLPMARGIAADFNIHIPDAQGELPRESYRLRQPDSYHERRSAIQPIELPAEDARYANAYAVNPHAMEAVVRATGHELPQDTGALRTGGIHFSPYDSRLIASLLERQRIGRPGGTEPLEQAARRSAAESKSLVLVRTNSGQRDLPEEQIALREELNHALQIAASGQHNNQNHLGEKAREFLATRLGATAGARLLKRGYRLGQDQRLGQLAAEVGVRLMEPGREAELGLSAKEANALRRSYVKHLEEIYGKAAAERISKRIKTAESERNWSVQPKSGEPAAGVRAGRGPTSESEAGGVVRREPQTDAAPELRPGGTSSPRLDSESGGDGVSDDSAKPDFSLSRKLTTPDQDEGKVNDSDGLYSKRLGDEPLDADRAALDDYSRKEIFGKADHELIAPRRNLPGRLRVNWQAAEALSVSAGKDSMNGVVLRPADISYRAQLLSHYASDLLREGSIGSAEFARLHGLAKDLDRFAKQHPNEPLAIYRDEASFQNRRPVRREELIHQVQHVLGGGDYVGHVNSEELSMHPAWSTIKRGLGGEGYSDDKDALAAEAAARLGARAETFPISEDDRISFLQHYRDVLAKQHGATKADSAVRFMEPTVREGINNGSGTAEAGALGRGRFVRDSGRNRERASPKEGDSAKAESGSPEREGAGGSGLAGEPAEAERQDLLNRKLTKRTDEDEGKVNYAVRAERGGAVPGDEHPGWFNESIRIPKLKDSARYVKDAADSLHARQARIWRIDLPEADAKRADAFVVNRQVMELISRWRGFDRDDYSEMNPGLHIHDQSLDFIARKANEAMRGFAKQPEALVTLRNAALGARQKNKSLVLVNGSHEDAAVVLQEELDHALQASLDRGTALDKHLGDQVVDFLNSPEGEAAMRSLNRYKFRSLGHAAAEIGVRLMAHGRHDELGLSAEDSGKLGDLYERLLGKAYGDHSTEEIRSRLQTARTEGPGSVLRLGNVRQGNGEVLRGGATGRPEAGPDDQPATEGARGIRQDARGNQGGERGTGEDVGGTPGKVSGDGINESLSRKSTGDEDEALTAQRHFSNLGDWETKWLDNLTELRRAAPKAFLSAVNAASAEAKSAVMRHTAMPLIVKALNGSMPLEQFMRAGIEGRLRGRQDFYREQAETVERMTDPQIERNIQHVLPLFEKIADHKGLDRNLGHTLASLADKGDWKTARAFIADAFHAAASAVTHIMSDEQFEATRHTPEFQDALRLYKDRIEAPMQEAHLEHEGILTSHPGPLKTYFPLIPLKADKVKMGVSSKPAYGRPGNRFNNFATGLAEDYDTSMEEFGKRLAAGVRASGRAGLVDALKEEGLMQPLSAGLGPDRNIIAYKGVPYYAVARTVAPAKMIVQGGKLVHIPEESMLLPAWLAGETDPILDKSRDYPPPDPTMKEIFDNLIHGRIPTGRDLAAILDRANDVAVSGFGEPVFHGMNLIGTLIANTPFLGSSTSDKAASLPLVKLGGAVSKILHTKTTGEEDAAELMEMSKLGMLSSKFGNTTYSKAYADATGSKLKRTNFSASLWGPSGADTRTRLFMYRLAKQLWKMEDKSPDDYIGMHEFVNQLGIYSQPLSSKMIQKLKSSVIGRMVAPFVTAGTTMNRNALHALAGTGPLPKGRPGLRLWTMLNSAIGIALIAAYAHKMMNGKWPWDDKYGKLGEMAIRRENVTSEAGKALYRQLYGNQPVGYVRMNFFNPLAMRGLRASGIKGAADTAMEGGKWWQSINAAERDVANSWAHPFIGPVPRTALVAITGHEASLQGVDNEQGKLGPSLFQAPVERNKGGNPYAKRALATAEEWNSSLSGLGAGAGETMFPELFHGAFGEPKRDEGNAWTRMAFSLATPGLVGSGTNPDRTAAFLRRQAAEARRQK